MSRFSAVETNAIRWSSGRTTRGIEQVSFWPTEGSRSSGLVRDGNGGLPISRRKELSIKLIALLNQRMIGKNFHVSNVQAHARRFTLDGTEIGLELAAHRNERYAKFLCSRLAVGLQETQKEIILEHITVIEFSKQTERVLVEQLNIFSSILLELDVAKVRLDTKLTARRIRLNLLDNHHPQDRTRSGIIGLELHGPLEVRSKALQKERTRHLEIVEIKGIVRI
jgi:hypothetical protein